MTRLSVNINKVATIRNARGGNVPDVIQVAIDCERFGAHGITVHPRPDERHITRDDVYKLKQVVTTEFNIEGYPSDDFMKLILEIKPEQVTFVPDPPHVLTSNAGWDTVKHRDFLSEIINKAKTAGIRTSIFTDTDIDNIEAAVLTGTDRIELYTEPYATFYSGNREDAVLPFVNAAIAARNAGLEINAGHDLSLENLEFFSKSIPWLKEVSIGHALISDALYFGLENTIQLYINKLVKE